METPGPAIEFDQPSEVPSRSFDLTVECPSPVASGSRIGHIVPVPPGTYSALITGQTAGANHDIAITITVR
jgi:hypothetical protein